MPLADEVALLRQEGEFRQAEAREDRQDGKEAMRIPQASHTAQESARECPLWARRGG